MGEFQKNPAGACRNGCFHLMGDTSVETFLFNPGLVQKVLKVQFYENEDQWVLDVAELLEFEGSLSW